MHRRLEDLLHPWQAGRVVRLDLRRQIGSVVKRADGYFQSIRVPVCQRRAAARAKAANEIDRGLEIGRFLARPLDPAFRRADEGGEERSELLLAHAAVADRRTSELAMDAETHRAALAAAGSRAFCHDRVSAG